MTAPNVQSILSEIDRITDHRDLQYLIDEAILLQLGKRSQAIAWKENQLRSRSSSLLFVMGRFLADGAYNDEPLYSEPITLPFETVAHLALAELEERARMTHFTQVYHTQGGGTVVYSDSVSWYVFVDPADGFSRGDTMPDEWGIA